MENINTIKQHVGLIVPLAEEFRILTKIFPILSTDNIDAVDYYHLKCPVSNISLTAIVLGDLGINIASQLSEKLINHINPSIIILIGIAGAIDRDLKLGDVVIANEINEFLASAKTVNKDDAYIFKYSGNHWKTTFSLAQLATNFEFAHKLFYISWTKKAEMSQKELNILPKQCQLFNQIPQILVGHIASGDVVGASKAYTIELQGIERKFLALEMEAAGVAQAAYGRANPVDTMVIRGISDFSDERKHDLDASQNRIWRSYAMYNASNFLFEFIKSIVEGTSASSPITTSKSNRPRKKNLDSDNDKPLPNSSQSINTYGCLQTSTVISEKNLDRVIPLALFSHKSSVNSISISPTEPVVIAAFEDHTIELLSLISGNLLGSFDHKVDVTSISYSNDGKTFATAALNQIFIWKSMKSEPIKTFAHHNVRVLKFSPNNKMLASGGGSIEGTVCLWSLVDNIIKQTLYDNRPICNLAFSPNGMIIAVSSEDTPVKLWRVSDGKLMHTLHSKYQVDSIAFSPDGLTILTGSRDNRICLWRTTDGSPIYTIKKQGGPIRDVFFSKDGELGISASEDHTINFWRLSDRNLLKILDNHNASINCASLSKDGAFLLSGDNSGMVIAWGVK